MTVQERMTAFQKELRAAMSKYGVELVIVSERVTGMNGTQSPEAHRIEARPVMEWVDTGVLQQAIDAATLDDEP